MAYESKGFWDAKEQADKDLSLNKKSTSSEAASSDISINHTNFPNLRKPSMTDEFKIKQIGGHQREDSRHNLHWPAPKPTPKHNQSNTSQTRDTKDNPTAQLL